MIGGGRAEGEGRAGERGRAEGVSLALGMEWLQRGEGTGCREEGERGEGAGRGEGPGWGEGAWLGDVAGRGERAGRVEGSRVGAGWWAVAKAISMK